MRLKTSFFTLFFLATGSTVFAANIYWVGIGPSSWSNTANWSYSSAGPSCGCTPTAADVANFDGENGSTGTVTLDLAPSVGAIQLTGFLGSINLNGFNLTVGGLVTNSIFNSGSFSGTGTINITATSSVSFLGTDLGANVNLATTLTTATGVFTGGTGSIFSGVVNVTAYSIILNGSTYQSTTTFTKTGATGATDDVSAGGNTFNGTTSFINSGNGTLRLADVNGDTFNGSVRFEINSTGVPNRIKVAHNGNNFFNNNIVVRSSNSSPISAPNNAQISITFGGGTGASTLANGFTISEGGTDSFLRGTLQLKNFTQQGTTAQALHLAWITSSCPCPPGVAASGSALILIIESCVFTGNAQFEASEIELKNSIYNGTINRFSKISGGSNTISSGGNIFGDPGNPGTITIINGTTNSNWTLANTSPNDFNGNVIFYKTATGTGTINVSTSGASTISGNITIHGNAIANWGTACQFGAITLDGTTPQSISETLDFIDPVTSTLKISKASNHVTLNIPITITTNLDLTQGNLLTTATNLPTLNNNAIVTNASNVSYVDGPIKKIGDDAITFPLGEAGYYRPIAISAPTNVADQFTAEYVGNSYSNITSMDPSLIEVTSCNYWTLDRTAGTSNVVVTLSWNDNACPSNFTIGSLTDLRVARWDGTTWKDHGNDGAPTGGTTSGTIKSNGTVTMFSPFALATITNLNVLPIELTSITAELENSCVEIKWQTASELNNEYFTIERSNGEMNRFDSLGTVRGAHTTNSVNNYSWTDTHPSPGQLYYRVKQTDVDGNEKYSKLVTVLINSSDLGKEIPYPNPVKDNLFLDRLPANDDSVLEIVDAVGGLIYQGKLKPIFDFENLPSGIYTLRIKTNALMRQYRVTKN